MNYDHQHRFIMGNAVTFYTASAVCGPSKFSNADHLNDRFREKLTLRFSIPKIEHRAAGSRSKAAVPIVG